MTGDFARVTFDRLMHFSRVLQNQGRVTLEADWNEQGAIFLHLLRTLIVDLAGPAWRAGKGFEIGWDAGNKALTIAGGHCYIDGLLCENEQDTNYAAQPWRPLPEDVAPTADTVGFAYIDAWERHVTAVELPALREVALGGAETTTRAQVVWQVRALDIDRSVARLKAVDSALAKRLDWAKGRKDDDAVKALEDTRAALDTLAKLSTFTCDQATQVLQAPRQALGLLRAAVPPGQTQNDPCSISPDARYRGRENQLYRVEIHDP